MFSTTFTKKNFNSPQDFLDALCVTDLFVPDFKALSQCIVVIK